MDFQTARLNMVQQQIRTWGVLDPKILELLSTLPREEFVPSAYKTLAFSDAAIPIGYDQVMLPPKIVGRMLQALTLSKQDSVLEVGTGTGYITALLSELTKRVLSLEIIPELAQVAQDKLNTLNLHNIDLRVANGAKGWFQESPYDVIAITGSLPVLPPQLREQLAVKGRLFVVVGAAPVMTAKLIIRQEAAEWSEQNLFETVIPSLLEAPQPELFRF